MEDRLKEELTGITHIYGNLILAKGPLQKVYWAQNIWFEPQIIPFSSISEGARKLAALQKLWSFYPYRHFRRGELIRAKLPYFAPKPIPFPACLPKAPLGAWMLLDEKTILAAPYTSSPFAQGEVHFQEDKTPPSRAYLKLWEALVRLGDCPKKGEECLEIGASPGSWTWVLAHLGARVTAVDRAPLAPEVGQLRGVTFLKKDAFSLDLKDYPSIKWLFSDLISYPEKLVSWVLPWIELYPELSFVITLKFQGENRCDVAKLCEKVPGSQVVHLFHNKHELTWMRSFLGINSVNRL